MPGPRTPTTYRSLSSRLPLTSHVWTQRTLFQPKIWRGVNMRWDLSKRTFSKREVKMMRGTQSIDFTNIGTTYSGVNPQRSKSKTGAHPTTMLKSYSETPDSSKQTMKICYPYGSCIIKTASPIQAGNFGSINSPVITS